MGEEFFKSRGSGQRGSRVDIISRVGLVRVESRLLLNNGSERGGSRGDERLTCRVGSLPARNGLLSGRASIVCELFFADPRVGPAQSARGSNT